MVCIFVVFFLLFFVVFLVVDECVVLWCDLGKFYFEVLFEFS